MSGMWSLARFRDNCAIMNPILQFESYVTLLGAGECAASDLAQALELAPVLVAADGGADRALRAGLVPDAVIGDLDSISDQARDRIPADRLIHISEQDSTDFDKALRSVGAPLVLALGMLGPRADHMLAGLNVLVGHPDRRCILVSHSDVVFLAPPRLDLTLPPGARVSLFPMAPVRGTSTGLDWPIDGLEFRPGDRIGTSNRCTDGQVSLTFESPVMLVLLDRAELGAAIAALV